jgi:predicted XRE-type DNA-binding protein
MNNKTTHRGTDFRDFLAEDGILEEVEARALKRAVALQLATLIEQQSLSKADMALRMKTSRAAVDRMLDGTNPSMTLATLEKAARALGQRIKLELIPA